MWGLQASFASHWAEPVTEERGPASQLVLQEDRGISPGLQMRKLESREQHEVL